MWSLSLLEDTVCIRQFQDPESPCPGLALLSFGSGWKPDKGIDGVGGGRLGVVPLMLASTDQHISMWKGDLPQPSSKDVGDVRPLRGLGSREDEHGRHWHLRPCLLTASDPDLS